MHDRLSRRRLLASVATVGGAGVLGGAGSVAFLSDREKFANDRLVAGAFDLRLAWRESYLGRAAGDALTGGALAPADFLDAPVATREQYPDGGVTFETAGGEGACASDAFADADDDLDPTSEGSLRSLNDDTYDAESGRPRPLISLQDVKPGDLGLTRFRLLLCDNPGYVSATGGLRSLAENDLTEPERKDPDQPPVGTGGEGGDEGQLADELRVRLYQDRTGSGVRDVLAGVGGAGATGREVAVALSEAFRLESAPTLRVFADALSAGVGIPLDGDPFGGDGETVSPASDDLFLYDVTGAAATDRDCFAAGDVGGQVGIVYALPVDHANEIQTDSVAVDVGFYAEQCRHNPGDDATAGREVSVRVENVAPEPVAIDPGVAVVHEETLPQVVQNPMFPQSATVEPLATLVRTGDPAPLVDHLRGEESALGVATVGADPSEVNGREVPVEPGEAYEFTVPVSPSTRPVDLAFALPVAGSDGLFLGPGDGLTLYSDGTYTAGEPGQPVTPWQVDPEAGTVRPVDNAEMGVPPDARVVRVSVTPSLVAGRR